MPPALQRCPWPTTELDIEYHDTEWGVPVRNDDNRLFEMLTLEGAQAGLSWSTILNKREGYRDAFHGFDIERVAAMPDSQIETLISNPAIVRHRGKIESTITNARAIIALRDHAGAFSDWLWSFVDHTPIKNAHRILTDVPSQSPHSLAMSKALKKRGFRFVGPTTCYAFMQACGMANDHLITCPRHAVIAGMHTRHPDRHSDAIGR